MNGNAYSVMGMDGQLLDAAMTQQSYALQSFNQVIGNSQALVFQTSQQTQNFYAQSSAMQTNYLYNLTNIFGQAYKSAASKISHGGLAGFFGF